ncbi:MAG TPA: Na+/H+ antiporter subunit E, partial [Polymorphobacter sp.]|nr:Na+/H+ antiporter subunit E [Polymorphobacter sp.]
PPLPSPRAAALGRAFSLGLIWLLLMPSAKPADLLVGVCAVVAATLVSLRLYAPAAGSVHLASLLALMPHFIWQSVLAGFDVARRAFDPRLPLQPGFVTCPLDFPEGIARNTFATITSLMPGTVPCGEIDGVLEYHCLDIRQPVVEQLWAEERKLARALTAGRRHG